jgi:DNA replication protein DnaC
MSLDLRLPILLRQLRLPTVAANYRKFAQEALHSGQPYEEYLLALLEHEANQRDVNRRKRRVQEARFPVLRTLDEFDFAALPSLNRTKVLDLARGEYIERHENVALIGSIGTGKPQPMHYPYRFDVLSRADRNGC